MLTQIFPITQRLPKDRNVVGGKAAGLGDLCRAGVAVPDGVVVVMPAMMPASAKEIMPMVYRLLQVTEDEASLFAVRSSTILEDGASFSYAGMFQTFLNVPKEGIWTAVVECVSTMASARVVAYREQHNASPWPETVPIIIQRMVSSSVAGVAFTVNPVSHNRNHFTIEAAPGFGDAVVSGGVTPDLYVVDVVARKLVEFERGDWPGDLRARALSDSQLGALVAMMQVLRSGVGHELDIEFAFEGADLFALQMRPVTTVE
jgi:phosphoenolpyruvate synthase/pyruvate phosphate dikinase